MGSCCQNILPVGLFGVLLAAGSSSLVEGTEDGELSPYNSSFLVTSSLRTSCSTFSINNDAVYDSRTPYVTLNTNI